MEYKSQQIETRDLCIRNLTAEVEALSQSLHEKETTAAQLQSELQSCQKGTSTSQQLTLITEIAELRQRLSETEYIKQQVVLEREAAVQEVEAKQKSEVQLHKNLGKLQCRCLVLTSVYNSYNMDTIIIASSQMNLLRSKFILKA